MSEAPREEGSLLLASEIERLLLALPPAQRVIVLLRYQEDLLPGEIAEMLQMPLATVKSHLQRALKLMRARAEDTLKEYTRHG
jgi:RNA polymerase sigma-70 factor (ECF subfamily)